MATYNMFLKNLITLAGGTALAQILPLLIAPLLARIYSPTDFAIYGVFLASIAFTGVVATLRYDFATSQAIDDKDSHALLIASVFVSFFVFIVLLIIAISNSFMQFAESLYEPSTLYLISVSTMLMGAAQSLTYFINRNGGFKIVAKLKIMQATIACLSMVFMSDFFINGLVVGHVLGQLVFIIYFLFTIKFSEVTYFEMKKVIIEYSDYPKKSLPGSVLNSIYLQAPLFFITLTFQPLFVGYYSFINRYIAGPLGIVSVAISQVLLKELVKSEVKKIKRLFFKILLVNLLIVSIFIMLVVTSGEQLVPIILGSNWKGVYPYLVLLSISISVRYVVSSVSVILTKRTNIHLALHWQVCSLLSLGVFLIVIDSEISFLDFLTYYIVLDVFMYCLYLYQIKKGISYLEN